MYSRRERKRKRRGTNERRRTRGVPGRGDQLAYSARRTPAQTGTGSMRVPKKVWAPFCLFSSLLRLCNTPDHHHHHHHLSQELTPPPSIGEILYLLYTWKNQLSQQASDLHKLWFSSGAGCVSRYPTQTSSCWTSKIRRQELDSFSYQHVLSVHVTVIH